MAVTLAGIPDGASVLVDTNPIIYVLEQHPEHAPHYLELFAAAESGRIDLIVTAITLAEILGGPARAGNEVLFERYEQTLTAGRGIRFRALDAAIAAHAARLRARYRLRLPDAFQLAVALHEGCHALVTHDRDFSRVTELPILS